MSNTHRFHKSSVDGNRTIRAMDYQLSPRAWLGWQSCNGIGFRATYFRFDESANREAVTAVAGATPVYLFVYGAGGDLSRNANANIGQTLVSNHALKLSSLDLEATQLFRWRQSQAILGMGVRIADMEQARSPFHKRDVLRCGVLRLDLANLGVAHRPAATPSPSRALLVRRVTKSST